MWVGYPLFNQESERRPFSGRVLRESTREASDQSNFFWRGFFFAGEDFLGEAVSVS